MTNFSLKDIRLMTGMSVTEFSKAFGIEDNVYCDWENMLPAPKPYIVNMIYELCVYRGYIILDADKIENKSKNYNIKTTQAIMRLLLKMSKLTNEEFMAAVNADDYARCYQMIDKQLALRRIEQKEYDKLNEFIKMMDI